MQPSLPHPPSSAQVLVVVEGPNDIEFLRRIGALLHREDPSLPDLADMERRLALVFAPTGGVDLSTAFRFAGLSMPEVHLLEQVTVERLTERDPNGEVRAWLTTIASPSR